MSKMNQSRRLVLTSGFANEGMGELLQRTGWEFLYTHPPGITDTTEYVWRLDPAHTFHFFECTKYPVEYCMVVGPQANDMLAKTSINLDFLDVDDLAAAFDRSTTVEEKEVTTFALGLAAGDVPDEAIFTRIVAALNDADPRVRLAGIDAAYIAAWDTLRGELERLSVSDPDETVRATAGNALAIFTSEDSPDQE